MPRPVALLLSALLVGVAGCSTAVDGTPAPGGADAATDVYTANSASMEPAIRRGETFRARRVSDYRGRRQDVVVFEAPASWVESSSDRATLVKRVLAVGGDVVQCCDPRNRVLLNGEPVDEPYLDYPPQLGPARQQAFGPVTVPADHLWLLGDSRNNSADSRSPANGPVVQDAVIGVVLARG